MCFASAVIHAEKDEETNKQTSIRDQTQRRKRNSLSVIMSPMITDEKMIE